MKTFEEVVRDKKNWSKKTNVPLLEPLSTNYFSDVSACTNLKYNIDGLNIKNCVELIERLTPFFYHLISSYSRKNGLCNLCVSVDIVFFFINILE